MVGELSNGNAEGSNVVGDVLLVGRSGMLLHGSSVWSVLFFDDFESDESGTRPSVQSL